MKQERRRKPGRRTMESVCCPSTLMRQKLDFAAEYETRYRVVSRVTSLITLAAIAAALLLALGV